MCLPFLSVVTVRVHDGNIWTLEGPSESSRNSSTFDRLLTSPLVSLILH